MMSVERFNQLAEQWGFFIGIKSLEIVVVFLIVLWVWKGIRTKVPAQIGYLLFLLVLIKPILPTYYALSMGNPVWHSPVPEMLNPDPPVVSIEDEFNVYESIEDQTEISVLPKEISPAKLSRRDTIARDRTSDPLVLGTLAGDNQSAARQAELLAINPWFDLSPLRSLSIFFWLMITWATIVWILCARFLWCEWKTYRLIQRSDSLHPNELGLDFKRLRNIAGVRRTVRLVSSPWIQSPLVYGIFSPVLLIPQQFTDHYSEKQARWILLHEFAHIRRWDTLVKLFQKTIQFAFFFHPAVWMASQIMDQQREFACDDWAILRANISPHDCGESYLRVVIQSNCSENNFVKNPAPGLLGLNHSKRIVKERLMNILDHKRKRNFEISPHMMVSLIVLSVVIASFGGAVKAEDTALFTQPAEVAQVASPAEVAPVANPVTPDPFATSQTPPFPTDGFTVSGKQYVWMRSFHLSAENLALIELITQDGDIVIQPQEASKQSTIDAQAKIVIEPRQKNATLTEAEILAIKESVDAIVVVDPETQRLILHSKVLDKLPEGIQVSIDLIVYVPASLSVHATTEDGDIVANGIQAPVELKSEDGDIVATDMRGSLKLKTEDGDIHTSGCSGPIVAKTEDGDVVLEQVEKAVDAKTEDGDIVVSYASSPMEDCSLKTEDGSIDLSVPQDTKVTLDLQCGDGEIALDNNGFEGTRKENRVQGTWFGGGPTIQARTDDGDISISHPE